MPSGASASASSSASSRCSSRHGLLGLLSLLGILTAGHMPAEQGKMQGRGGVKSAKWVLRCSGRTTVRMRTPRCQLAWNENENHKNSAWVRELHRSQRKKPPFVYGRPPAQGVVQPSSNHEAIEEAAQVYWVCFGRQPFSFMSNSMFTPFMLSEQHRLGTWTRCQAWDKTSVSTCTSRGTRVSPVISLKK